MAYTQNNDPTGTSMKTRKNQPDTYKEMIYIRNNVQSNNKNTSIELSSSTRKELRKENGDTIYPTPPLGQDMTQGQFFFKRSLTGLNSEFSFS